jgi:F-type H+-transporting ATPase subunit a
MTGLVLASSDPLHPVVQWYWERVGEPPFSFTLMSNIILMQLIALVLLIVFIPRLLRLRRSDDAVERLTPHGAGVAIEGVCAALRDHVARPALGRYTDQYIPYIWSAFFFVLTCNLLGLVPLNKLLKPFLVPVFGEGYWVGGTATGNIVVTGTLALCTLVMVVFNGLRAHGLAYVKHFFMGPFPISILIALLEVIGLVAKTFALCVRLFANMVAGHVLLVVLLGFISLAATGLGRVITLLVISPLVVAGSVAINMLELFVAFLQAFIFTFLTTIFIGQAVNIHHDHDPMHEQERAVAHRGAEPDELRPAPAPAATDS